MKLTLYRKKEAVNQMWAFKVYIDEALMGEIKMGETVEFFMEPGTHEIYLEVDDYFSDALSFQMTGDLVMECGTLKRSSMGILKLLMSPRQPAQNTYVKIL